MQSDDGLSFSMSVAILPEAAALDSIEALRTGMQSPEKSALQLKMLTPFFTPQVFAQRAVVEDLTTFCARRKPFTLRLDSLDIFEHGKRGFTVQLMPSVVSDSDLKDLRRLLEVQFPRCTGKIAFKPHMTLAPFATRPEAEAALEKIRASLTPIEWTVSKLHIVEEDGLKCTTLHSIALASATALPVAAVAPQLSPTPVFRFRDGKWTQIDVAKEPPSAPTTLSVVSWNVLYPVYKAELIFTDDRVPHVLRELEATNADVIGLQEVTKEFVAKLVAAEWVKQRYYVSDITGATVRPYGQLVLSLHPFSAAIHHWNNQKKMLFADFSLNNRRMIVSVLHLTSTLAKNAQTTRQAQMQLVYGLIPPGADSVIIGDFNVENEEEARGLLRADWIDCWASLRPEEAGLTFDPHVNTTANITSHSKVARRYDRCLARTHHLTPTSVGLFATDSIVWDATASAGARAAVLFASDHYGLKTCFKWDPNPALPSLDPLYSALAPHRPFECHAGVNVMTQLPARISAILLRCIPPPIVIQVSGGLRLGTFGPGSDADLVCFGRFAPAEFFELAKKALAAPESGVTSVHFIKEAFVPLITFRWNQIDVDLEYCCVPSGLELSRAPALMTNEHAKQMDERSLRCINGCRDWDLILSAVPDVPLFRLLVAAVKLWAKRRGVYVARMGFLGGFSYTVLAARIAQLYPRADSRELLCRFFADYAAWDWTRPVAVAVVDNPTFTPEARDQMSIVTLSRPVRNSARHVTVSTRQIIAAELGRAAAICKGAAGATLSELMDELVQPLAFFRQHQFYVQIAVSAVTKKEHAAFVGYVEGKFPVLLIRVEEARFVGFPLSHSTPNPDSGFPFSVSYWIGLDCGQADAVNVTATLVDVAATFRKTENMDILVKLRSAAEAEALAKGAGAAQNGEAEDDEEEEEEEADEAEAEAGEAGKPAAAAHTNAKGRWAPHKQKKYKRVDVDALDTGGAEAVPKTEKMRTGIEAYNRLKWDESVDVKDVVIGFEDRFLGVVECPWHEFDIENVPLHRLRYFKHKGIVVYDRIHRIDTLFHHRKSKP